MAFRHVAVLAGGMLLGGCQLIQPPQAEGIVVESVEARFVDPQCTSEPCAEVEIDTLRFPGHPVLSEQLRLTLLGMGMGIDTGETRPARTWEGFAQAFFEEARGNPRPEGVASAGQALLEASVYARYDDLLIVELDSYVYQAGQAHGMPLTQFMVIDERLARVVGLEDMLLEGQESAFHEALVQAHRQWLQQTGADDGFVANWPLSQSRNVAPLESAWIVKYNVYDIAPYAAGQPELRIPSEELAGIAKPRYLGVR